MKNGTIEIYSSTSKKSVFLHIMDQQRITGPRIHVIVAEPISPQGVELSPLFFCGIWCIKLPFMEKRSKITAVLIRRAFFFTSWNNRAYQDHASTLELHESISPQGVDLPLLLFCGMWYMIILFRT